MRPQYNGQPCYNVAEIAESLGLTTQTVSRRIRRLGLRQVTRLRDGGYYSADQVKLIGQPPQPEPPEEPAYCVDEISRMTWISVRELYLAIKVLGMAPVRKFQKRRLFSAEQVDLLLEKLQKGDPGWRQAAGQIASQG